MKLTAARTRTIERPLHRAIRDYAVQLGFKDLVYLNVGEPDFPTPKHVVEAGKKAMDEGFTHYTEDRGILPLREAIAGELKKTRDIDVNPKEGILVTSGGSEALASVLLSVADPGDDVIMPDPYYPPYVAGVRIAGGNPVPVPVNKETLQWDMEELKKAITPKTKVIIVNSPSNPTGGVYSVELLKGIADLAADHDLYMLTDEVYDAFIYGEQGFHGVAEFDRGLERTILANSFSKTFAMTGWRVGYIAAKPNIIADTVKVKGCINMCATSFAQKAAVVALTSPRDCVKDMLDEYRQRRLMLLDWLKKTPELLCSTPNGAFYAFPDASAVEKDSLEFTKYLVREAHVVVSPGVAFGAAGEGHIRISYANSREDLNKAFRNITDVISRYPKRK
ncbi:MAG: pyridoxal phosphate-dependent aminotransferase [Candidatus Bathyarchaeia archaeon]